MKRIVLFSFTYLALVACASSPKSNVTEATMTNSNSGLEYTKSVAPISLRAHDSQSCNRQVVHMKGLTWKQLMKEANNCVQSGNWAVVEVIGNQLAQVEHLSPWGAYYMSLAAESRKELPRAMWMIELALKKAPQSALLTYQQGRLQWLGNEQTSAQKTLKRATDLDPRLVDAQLLLGQMAMISGDYTEAGKRFQAALAVEPRHLPALLGWAEVRIRAKDSKEANEALAQAVFNHPSSYRARLRQAQVLEQMEKNFPEALNAYKRLKALERDRKLDALVDQDLDGKIRELESAVKQSAPNQLSLREPAEQKKGGK